MIRIDPWVYLWSALLLLVIPLDWYAAAVFAAVFHECSHLAAIRLLGCRIFHIYIGIEGAKIDAEIIGNGKELICAMAGPAGSFLLLALCHIFPQAAVCGFVQGIFNLLPVYPMDGGRMVKGVLDLCCPGKSEGVFRIVQRAVWLALLVTALTAGCLMPVIAILCIRTILKRKIPCKQRAIGVQ